MTLFLVANAALAWTGSDAYYDMSASNTADADAPTHSYIDISGTGTRLAVSDLDDGLSTLSGVLPPGTTFRF
ncbi:MAG: hypothetical protein H6736_24995, partial [Alphaproteobacteria bacterium]|nr:hypothetical protein [Alphaproteobacteria bacterium]